ncbi:MAG: 50S ribosomal protein L24 [Bacteroidota bacterium]|nr:50S ribosomal protein L24 [Bacteroidota bacterium]MDP4234713.1 50S ribosomal protein L24 [Bacteroidota bacterium]MDP4243936.1 50S ribosomal protein L24 [Bacteroidota bacterium]MDP4288841.1 50S ribosomal protein L24 [Bacteroidota bacterium]
MRVKKNDIVEVITGKSRGKTGKVLRVYPETNKVLVEGVNTQYKHERPSQQNQKGGITQREAPIDASNVMLLDPKTNLRTRIGKRELTGTEGKVRFERFSKRSGDVLA